MPPASTGPVPNPLILGNYVPPYNFGSRGESIFSYSGFAYCPAVDALLMFGGGHSATPMDNVVRFSLAKGAWESDYVPTTLEAMAQPSNLTPGRFWNVSGSVPPLRPVSRHSYDGWLWSSALKRMILLPTNNGASFGLTPEMARQTLRGNMALYDPVKKSWQDTGVIGTTNCTHCEDPATGNFLIANRYRFDLFDPRTLTLRPISGARRIDVTESLVYYPPNDRFYYFTVAKSPIEVYEIELDRAEARSVWTKVSTGGRPSSPRRRFVYDEASQILVGGLSGGKIYGFKPLGGGNGRWYSQSASSATDMGSGYSWAYVPRLNMHFFMSRTGSEGRRATLYAFRWSPQAAVEIRDSGSEPDTQTPPPPISEALELWDGTSGASALAFNAGIGLYWRNRGGDWLDANGVAQGDTPFGEMAFGTSSNPTPVVEVDITALAKVLQTINTGIFVRGRGTVHIATRHNADAAKRPKLILVDATGKQTIIECKASQAIRLSSSNPTTAEPAKLDANSNLLLHFELPEQPFTSARLRLTAVAHYSGRGAAHVMMVAQPLLFDSSEHDAQLGIANAYSNDVGVERHPDVYFADDWTTSDWRQTFFNKPNDTTIQRDGPLGGPAAHSRYPKGGLSSGLSQKHNWTDRKSTTRNPHNGLLLHCEIPVADYAAKAHQGCPEELYLRYYFMAKPGYQCSVEGKKLPGLAGQYGRWRNNDYGAVDGNGGSPTRGIRLTDGSFSGWSMRHHAAVGPADDNPYGHLVPLQYYAYHAEMTGYFGDKWRWGNDDLGWVAIEEGTWYCLEHRVRLNTIEGPFDALGNGRGAADGIVQGWLDGVLVFDKRDVVLRHHPAIKIDCVWMNHYHGGTKPAEHDHLFAQANIVVARRYIGPMAS